MRIPRLPAAALLAAILLQACGTAPASLFRGDRVTADRDFIYLDDPVFLQSKSVYGQRAKGFFSFRLPVYFNAGKQDTLRFARGDVSVQAGAPGPANECLVDTAAADLDSAAIAMKLSDSAGAMVFSPGRGGKRRIDLAIYCRDYDPPWGRMDTLSLAFQRKTGPEGYLQVTFQLPFHVSYRGPVVSIMIGLGLLYLFTQLGWWISES